MILFDEEVEKFENGMLFSSAGRTEKTCRKMKITK